MKKENAFHTAEQTDGIAEIMIDAIENLDSTLSLKRILHWHKKLFSKGYAMLSPIMGGQLRANQLQGKKPMQVVSGRIDSPTVHFEAPPQEVLDTELDHFIIRP